jgi:hypothetical protein
MSLTQLNSSCYDKINSEVNAFFTSGNYSGVNLSIFTDPEGTTFLTDSNGNVDTRRVASINHVASYEDKETGITTNPTITISFLDESSVTAVDTVHTYYYSLTGVPYVPRTFGTGTI